MGLLHAPCVSDVFCQDRQACVERLEEIVKAEPVPDVICIQDSTRYTLLLQSLCLHVQWFEVLCSGPLGPPSLVGAGRSSWRGLLGQCQGACLSD